MRAKNTLLVLTGWLLLAATSSAQTQIDYFSFPGWDHAAITGDGQTFTNIVNGIDVTVTASGVFDTASTGGGAINSSHDEPAMHEFVFNFSDPIRLAVQTMHLDSQERYLINGPGLELYEHENGLPPIQSMTAAGLALTGAGIGTDAAVGYTILSESGQTLQIQYEAFGNTTTKYNRFSIGQVVPEPATMGTLFTGVLCVLWRRRKSLTRSGSLL